jgi:DNA-directed RNA polymerase subunit M/transcription elongation factor TFIIS
MTFTNQVKQNEPAAVYSKPEARKILEYLLANTQTVLEPGHLPNDELQYRQVEKLLGEVPVDAVGLLREMTAAATLSSELVDKAPACPECGSKQLSTRYACPQCSTYDINRTYLFEHLKCGKVGNEGSFRKGDEVICPKCQAVLHNFGVEYRAVGVWYECNKCKNSFNVPNHLHFCRPNRHEFSPDRVDLVPVYKYELNRRAIEQIRKQVLVYAEAITFLENLGLTVKAPHSLPGKSGEPQLFDIVLVLPKKGWRSDEKIVAIDVMVSNSALEKDAVRNFDAKVKDAKPSDSYLIAVPRLSEEARILAKNLKLGYFEGSTLKEAMQAFQSKSVIKEYVG